MEGGPKTQELRCNVVVDILCEGLFFGFFPVSGHSDILVSIEGNQSEKKTLPMGVPQGSISGPLLP